MKSPKYSLSFFPLLAVISGCMVQHESKPGTATFGTAALEDSNLSAVVESSVQEQALEALMAMPTSFPIGYRDDRHAWERARVFFDKYITESDQKAKPVTMKVKKETWILSNRDRPTGEYVYEVRRVDDRKGYSYAVSCEPKNGGTQEGAQLNARNLSRFIRDGSLEVSLLRR